MSMYIHEYWWLNGITWNYNKVMDQRTWAEYSANLNVEYKPIVVNFDVSHIYGVGNEV